MLLPFLLATRMPDITGDQAVARTKEALLAFGVKGPFRIQSLGRTGMMPKPENWQVSLSCSAGLFEAYLEPTGRFWAIEKTPMKHPMRRGTISAADLSRANAWLKSIGPLFPTRLSTYGTAPSSAYFEAVIKGYPFVRRMYGYQFAFYDGQFVAWRAMEKLPALGPSVPKVTGSEALRTAIQAFHKYEMPGRLAYGGFVSNGLAWLETPRQKGAILVWRIMGQPRILGGSWTKSPAQLELYVDAVTGAVLPL